MATNDEIRAKDVVPELSDFRDDTDGLYGDGNQSSFFMKASNLAKSILGRIHLLPKSITTFRTGDVIPVDGPSGTAKMPYADLLKVTADNVFGDHRAISAYPAIYGEDETYSSYDDLPLNSSILVLKFLLNAPNRSWGKCFTFAASNNANFVAQLLVSTDIQDEYNNCIYYRSKRAGTWTQWDKVLKIDDVVKEINENLSKNLGTITPKFVNLSCDSSGSTTTYTKTRFASELIDIENFVLCEIDSDYAWRIFLFDENKAFLTFFDWDSDSKTQYDILKKDASTKYIRIYFCKKGTPSPDLTYSDIDKVKVFCVNVQSEAISSMVNGREHEKTLGVDYSAVWNTTGQKSTNPDATRAVLNRFIPINLATKVSSKSASIRYRLCLYTSDGCLDSDFIEMTPYTTSDTLISSVLSDYPTAKFFKVVIARDDDSELPGEVSDYIEIETEFKRSEKLTFERGNLTDVGSIDISYHNADNVTNFAKFRTGRYIDVKGNKKARFVNNNGGDLTVYEYDSSFSFVCKTDSASLVDFVPATKYIKIMVTNCTDDPFVTMYSDEGVGYAFNQYSSSDISFLFEVANVDPTSITESDIDASQYSSTKYFDSGILRLPPNYNVNGNPVPLIIFNHGSAEYGVRYYRTDIFIYQNERNYLIKEGYAILDCFGASSKYSNGDSELNENTATPDNISCMVSAYNWIVNNYNIDTNNVFSMGKSHGGLMTLAMAYTKSIPVKACALLCPLLNWFDPGVGLGCYSYSHRVTVANQLGFENVGSLDTTALEVLNSADYKTYILGNIDKMIGNNPFLMGIDGTNAYTITEKSIELDWDDPIFNVPRTCYTPIKVWGASDDTSVMYKQELSLVNSIKNGKGISAFRRMPTGTGAHHSVDNDPNALKVASIVTKLGYTCVDVPLAYAEVVQWFRRFGSC